MLNKPLLAPAASLVLALGKADALVASEVQCILKNSDPRRYRLTRFLALLPESLTTSSPRDHLPLTLALLGAECPQVPSVPPSQAVRFRRQVFQSTIHAAPRLHTILQKELHDLRAHALLIQLGLGEQLALPLNLILLCDLSDPWASGALPPLLAILQPFLAEGRECRGFLLLNTAIFPFPPAGDAPPTPPPALGWLSPALQELNSLSDPQQGESRQSLAQLLHLPGLDPITFPVLIFDHRKEGELVVKDQPEMQIILGNILLALLSGPLVPHLSTQFTTEELQERKAFFSGAAATALVFDPTALIEACAGRLLAEFVRQNLGPQASPSPTVQQELFEKICRDLGELPAWLRACASETGLELSQQEGGRWGFSLRFADLTFADSPEENWAVAIEQYAQQFEVEKLPALQETLRLNLANLKAEVSAWFATALENLPQHPRAYPGGLQVARQVLEQLEILLNEQSRALSGAPASPSPEDEQNALQALRAASATLPRLPAWVPRLVAFLRPFVNLEPLVRWWRYRKVPIIRLRQECVHHFERKYAVRLEGDARQVLHEMVAYLSGQIKAAFEGLQTLSSKVDSLEQEGMKRWRVYPSPDSLFRPVAGDQLFTEWAYARWLPPAVGQREALLSEYGLLRNWQTVSTEELAARALEYGRQVYSPARELTLSEVVEHSSDQKAADLLLLLAQGAVPLLRPDFDAIGGGGLAITQRFVLLSESISPAFSPTLQSVLANWTPLISDDDHTLLCCRFHQALPLRSLTALLAPARQQYQTTIERERQDLHLIPPPHLLTTSAILDDLDPGNPDFIHKVFRWSFTPKKRGRAKVAPLEQQIELDLSRDRYAQHRQEERLPLEKWDHYAAKEMPEIRALATCFQNLHARQEWSTLQQASNVLSFVQQCIPYSRDPDTTGHADWVRYPIETLMEETGDCEDVSVLTAAILVRLCFQVALLLYPKHVAVGVGGAENLKGHYISAPDSGIRYFYAESTASGWHIGEVPKEYRDQPPDKILPIHILIEEEE